jgi:demethylmenaquinone methyltransferase / 2-methoxy-6-polyprenyl-1,4-benzoquinol methylase
MVRSMFDSIAPRYDLVNRMMTFGLDVRWRRRSARALGLPTGSRVLDLACGTGDFLTILGGAGLRPFGLDLSWGMLAAGRSGRPLAQADGAALPMAAGSVDGITCGYALRNFAELGPVLAELGRVVRPGGRLSLLEVAEPERGLLLLGHRIWFRRVVPLIGAVLSDGAAYRYLPKSTAYLPPTAELRRLLRDAGFSAVNHRLLSGGLSQLITATREGRL